MKDQGRAGHLFRAAEVLAKALANSPARGAVVERCAHIDFEQNFRASLDYSEA